MTYPKPSAHPSEAKQACECSATPGLLFPKGQGARGIPGLAGQRHHWPLPIHRTQAKLTQRWSNLEVLLGSIMVIRHVPGPAGIRSGSRLVLARKVHQDKTGRGPSWRASPWVGFMTGSRSSLAQQGLWTS